RLRLGQAEHELRGDRRVDGAAAAHEHRVGRVGRMGIRGSGEKAARGDGLLVGPSARPFGRRRKLRVRGPGREYRRREDGAPVSHVPILAPRACPAMADRGPRAGPIRPAAPRTHALQDILVEMRMDTIIAGRYDGFEAAAKGRLVEHGFPLDAISVFFNNPPGRHDMTEIGGDEHADPEAKHAAGGAIAGAAAGAGLGLAAMATGPFGVAALAATGAYVGALAGAVNATDETHHEQPTRRASGVIVGVLADGHEDEAIRVL